MKDATKKISLVDRIFSGLNAKSNYVSSRDRVFFLENLSILIKSGMPINAILSAIIKEARSVKMKEMVAGIQMEIDAGASFTDALSKYNFLPQYSMSLIRAGEKSGRFSQNLQVIVDQQAKDAIFSARLKGAMIYPVIVLIVGVLIVIGLSYFVFPKLITVFEGLNVALPWTTRMLIVFGKYIDKNGAVAIPLFLIGFFLLLYFLFFYSKTKVIGQRIIMFLPGFHRIVFESEMARFGYLLGTLFGAGLPVLVSLEALKESSTYHDYRDLYAHIQFKVEEGFTFEEAFASYRGSEKLIPPAVQQMIVTGEKSGNLAKALQNIGTVYEVKIDITSKNLATLLEPVMLVVIFVGVMLLALSVIQPVYGLLSGLDVKN